MLLSHTLPYHSHQEYNGIDQNHFHPAPEGPGDNHLPTNMASPNLTTTPTFPEGPNHPYYPLHAEIAFYAANKTPVPYLLAAFFATTLALLTCTYNLTTTFNPRLTKPQLATILWFTLSGSIHVFFEGYYVLHFSSLGGDQSLLGQMWKEYAFSDSRYLTRDPFVLCVESVTAAVWGPGCFLCAWLVARGHEARWAAVVVVSLGQMYGEWECLSGGASVDLC